MNIYSCVDSNNIDKIIVLFNSCYQNASKRDKLNFYLLIDKENDNIVIPSYLNLMIKVLDYQYLKNNGWIEINNNFSKNFYKQGGKCNHIMNFARFFIFHHFMDIETAIYLDWDMIVQDDIFNLEKYYQKCDKEDVFVVANSLKWKDIGNNIIDGTKVQNDYFKNKIINSKNYNFYKSKLKEVWSDVLIKCNDKLNNILDYKLNLNDKTFNAGFNIVNSNIFDLDKLKKLVINLIEIQKDKEWFRFGTQVIMNLITDKKEFVDSKWNNSDYSSSIIHWSGPIKPWDDNNEIWSKYKILK